MPGILTIPPEVRVRIFQHIAASLRHDHEEGIRQAYIDYGIGPVVSPSLWDSGHSGPEAHHRDEPDDQAQRFSAGYIRLGFELPLPMSVLLLNRQFYAEGCDFVFTRSPLRIDVGEDNEGCGTYPHYDEQTGPKASFVAESWTMLAGRLTPKEANIKSDLLANVGHITQHPSFTRLRELHVNHWIAIETWDPIRQDSDFLVSGNPVGFVSLIRSMASLRRLVVFLDITYEIIDNFYGGDVPNPTAYVDIESTPVLRVASESYTTPIEIKFLVTEVTDSVLDEMGIATGNFLVRSNSKDRLIAYLRLARANGLDVGLFYEFKDYQSEGSYPGDARRFKSAAKRRNPGLLGDVWGCALRPG